MRRTKGGIDGKMYGRAVERTEERTDKRTLYFIGNGHDEKKTYDRNRARKSVDQKQGSGEQPASHLFESQVLPQSLGGLPVWR